MLSKINSCAVIGLDGSTVEVEVALSARAFHRVLKLSRTIVDLAGVETIGVAHLAGALQYRPRS